VVRVEHVIGEGLELADLLLNAVREVVDILGATSDGFKVVTQNGEELLLHLACSLEVLEDHLHVLGLVEDILDAGEVPTADGHLSLDVHLGLLELLGPLVEHVDALTDD